eukprot:SAG31_NODE_2884_length_4954_cov_2.669619_6_plen_71_part_00
MAILYMLLIPARTTTLQLQRTKVQQMICGGGGGGGLQLTLLSSLSVCGWCLEFLQFYSSGTLVNRRSGIL